MLLDQDHPFAGLPAALVEEMLQRTTEVSEELLLAFTDTKIDQSRLRGELEGGGWLRHESSLPNVQIPTTCGIDGAFAIERLLATDIVAAAGVGAEGLTPPSEKRLWPENLQYQTYLVTEPHSANTGTIVRALMIGMELDLASSAPHDVVFIDGSLTTPLIFLNQALNAVKEHPNLKASIALLRDIQKILDAYFVVLRAERTDRAWVGVPKYTTRREIGSIMGWPASQDDRAVLTNVLKPGEFTKPIALYNVSRSGRAQDWHLNTELLTEETANTAKKITFHLSSEIRVIYYRPHLHLPAVRLEISRSIAETPGRLAAVIEAVRHQCATGAIFEPYPLYIADRWVKTLSTALPAFRQVASQRLAASYDGDFADIFLALHGYRTESGG